MPAFISVTRRRIGGGGKKKVRHAVTSSPVQTTDEKIREGEGKKKDGHFCRYQKRRLRSSGRKGTKRWRVHSL